MLGLEQNIILSNASFSTEYQKTIGINISRFEKLDFFIYISNDNGGSITTLDFILECSGYANPTESDWAKLSYESFDQASGTFLLKDYIIRKIITSPTTIVIRSRSQGIYVRLGIKANTSGGLYDIGVTKKSLNFKT